MRPKPFVYKIRPRVEAWPVNRIRKLSEDEVLSGFVHDMEASALEERFARALDKRGLRYAFQYIVTTPFQIPGQKSELDFVVEEYGIHPIEVDGTWIHKSSAQKSKVMLRDAILDDVLGKYGWKKIIRVPGNDLESQEMADKTVEEIFT